MDETWRMEHMKYELSLEQRFRDGEQAGISQGISQGRLEGMAEEKRRIAKEMHSKGISEDIIASCTSLDISEVERIIKG